MEKKARKNTAQTVDALCRKAVEDAGYVLWDVDYYKEGADYNLLLTIEHPDRTVPVGLEDCEKVTRLIDPILDEADPIEESYYLEVSSPGLERELRKPEHFQAFLGAGVRVKLFSSLDGKKQLEGRLESFDAGKIVLLCDDGKREIEKEAVSRVTLLDPAK